MGGTLLRPITQLKDFSVVLTGWLRRWARLYSMDRKEAIALTEEDFAIYAEALSDLSPQHLDRACRAASEICSFFPRPADVRAQLNTAEAKGFVLEAGAEWQKLLTWIRENVFPDTGIRRGAPRLAPATTHAAKAAGGFYFIERCSCEELVWCRKNFLAAYRNVHETGLVEHLIGDGEARRILAQLRAGPPIECKQLSHPVEIPSQPPSREEVRAMLRRVMEEKPTQFQDPNHDQLAAEWQQQKEQARLWAIRHGMESALAQVDSRGQKPCAV